MNKVFITGKILNEIELVYYSNIPYIKRIELECEGQKYLVQCCQNNALNISKNASKNDILQIEGHLGKDKNNNEIIIIIADKVEIFRSEKTDSQLINELKDEDNISECLNQNTKMILSKMNPKHFVAMLNEVSKISSMFNSIIYEEEIEEDKVDNQNINSVSETKENTNHTSISNSEINLNIDKNQLKENQNQQYRTDAERL